MACQTARREVAVRWDELFADLEAQLEAAERAELAGEVADRSRREVARLRLYDRLRAAAGLDLSVTLPGAGTVHGTLEQAGPDWLLLAEPAARRALVPLDAVLSVAGLPAAAAEPGSQGQVVGRLDLRYALRGLARDRAAVTVTLRDGSALTGTLDRVGADFLELAEHAPAEPRRRDAVRGVRAVPLAAVVLVRSV